MPNYLREQVDIFDAAGKLISTCIKSTVIPDPEEKEVELSAFDYMSGLVKTRDMELFQKSLGSIMDTLVKEGFDEYDIKVDLLDVLIKDHL